MQTGRDRSRERGVTMVELAVSVVILALVMLAAHQGAIQAMRLFSSSETSLALEESGRRAMHDMVRELRAGGNVDNPSQPGNPLYAYPYIWTGNSPQGPYTSLALPTNELPVDTIPAGADPANGANSSLVFVVPITDGATTTDDSGDPIPLVWIPAPPPDPDAELVPRWGSRRVGASSGTAGQNSGEIVYRLVRNASGNFNRLERFDTSTGERTTLCNFVERLVFENYVMGGVAQQSEIRIRLFLRRQDDQGNWMKADISAVVALRSI